MSSYKGYRDINLPIDTKTLPNLDGLNKDDLEACMRVSMAPQTRTRVINRLHNRQHRNAGLLIPAWYLTGQGFETMAEIELMLPEFNAHGQITNAVDVHNGGQIAITIYNPKVRKENTFLVGRDDEVRIWKKSDALLTEKVDYDAVTTSGFLSVKYIAEHLTSFFGKVIRVKNWGSGPLTQIEVKGDDPDHYHLTLGAYNTIRLHESEIVDVASALPQPGFMRPGPYPWAAPRLQRTPSRLLHEAQTAFAEYSGMTKPNDTPSYRGDAWWMFNNRKYEGSTIQLGSGDPAKSGVKGVCTQIVSEGGQLVFVIDGFMYKRNRHTTVAVWDKKEN